MTICSEQHVHHFYSKIWLVWQLVGRSCLSVCLFWMLLCCICSQRTEENWCCPGRVCVCVCLCVLGWMGSDPHKLRTSHEATNRNAIFFYLSKLNKSMRKQNYWCIQVVSSLSISFWMVEDEAEVELLAVYPAHCLAFQGDCFDADIVIVPFLIPLSFLPSVFFHICCIFSNHFPLTGPHMLFPFFSCFLNIQSVLV